MNYGPQGACETASSNSASADGDYHSYHSHYNHATRSQYRPQASSNGLHNPLLFNGHHRLDEGDDDEEPEDHADDNHRNQQRLDDDEELDSAPDRPRLLMWGLKR
jgi:hypothetical protein